VKLKIKNLKFSSGFTLIEMLVTLGIITALSAMILGYSRKSETTTYLVREGNRIVFELRRAQNQAMLMLQQDSESGEVCGWGIHIEESILSDVSQEQFFLFADLCLAGESKGNEEYDSDEEVETISLLKGVEIFQSNVSSVLFIPPDPRVKFEPNLSDGESANIQIRLKNQHETCYEIQVSEAGQVYKGLQSN